VRCPLGPDLSYDQLTAQNGGMAMDATARPQTFGTTTAARHAHPPAAVAHTTGHLRHGEAVAVLAGLDRT
jgi:hypothetical protein